MITRDIIVVGASPGGETALNDFVKYLPKNFQGSIFIVLHIPPYTESKLPSILSHAGHLGAVHPKDGDGIEPGKIYITPNDHHMLPAVGKHGLLNGKVRQWKGGICFLLALFYQDFVPF